MTGERWLPISGYEGIYEVSDLGRVRRIAGSFKCRAPRYLRPRPTRKGYLLVALHNGSRRELTIHRLVLAAFVGPPPTERHEGNHRDGDKSNNRLSNLEWVTPRENVRHAQDHGLRPCVAGELNPRAKLTPAQVGEIRALQGRSPQREIAARYGVSKSLIGQIQAGKIWAVPA